ncbi:MAG: 16S rRNA (cytosine(1402)-N(4))-methyltransferase RsmH [Gemmatimonadota bacterium]
MSDLPSTYHEPVLLREVLNAARGARRAVDGTVGGGGHAASLLDTGVTLLAIDRDPVALEVAGTRLAGRDVTLLLGAFGERTVLEAVQAFHPDFILLDLGVSSRQLDDETRGFSFRPGAPLDMRMSSTGTSAADLLNEASEEELRDIFSDYADERRAGRLAREVVRRRDRGPHATSDDLVNAIRAVLGPQSGPSDFARIFQAVRIAVNDELGGLSTALPVWRDALMPDGALAIISYHSGEDRVVKHAFQDWARSCVCPPEQPICTCRARPLGTLEPRKPIVPAPAEVASNSRARSAKLRVFRVPHER